MIPPAGALPALEIEGAVMAALEAWLRNTQHLIAMIGDRNLAAPHLNQSLNAARQLADSIRSSNSLERRSLITAVVSRITIASGTLVLKIRRGSLLQAIGVADGQVSSSDATGDEQDITVPFSLRRRGVEARLILGDDQRDSLVDPVLVATIAKAHAWFAQLASGDAISINDIAHAAECSRQRDQQTPPSRLPRARHCRGHHGRPAAARADGQTSQAVRQPATRLGSPARGSGLPGSCTTLGTAVRAHAPGLPIIHRSPNRNRKARRIQPVLADSLPPADDRSRGPSGSRNRQLRKPARSAPITCLRLVSGPEGHGKDPQYGGKVRLPRQREGITGAEETGWWAHQDSNLEPDGYEPSALTIELWAPTGGMATAIRGRML
jgi:hypothetical protein